MVLVLVLVLQKKWSCLHQCKILTESNLEFTELLIGPIDSGITVLVQPV